MAGMTPRPVWASISWAVWPFLVGHQASKTLERHWSDGRLGNVRKAATCPGWQIHGSNGFKIPPSNDPKSRVKSRVYQCLGRLGTLELFPVALTHWLQILDPFVINPKLSLLQHSLTFSLGYVCGEVYTFLDLDIRPLGMWNFRVVGPPWTGDW